MKHRFILFLLLSFIACNKPIAPGYIAPFQSSYVSTYKNIVILGNSITYTPASPSQGWPNNCGMAATDSSLDYVHLLTAMFQNSIPSAKINILNIADFETNFDTYDLNANLSSLQALKPDLLILRIGENVTTTDEAGFESKYVALINYFQSNNPGVKVLAVGSVWLNRDLANAVMSRHSNYISLVSMQADLSNYSYGLFSNAAVAHHPSDKGMREISERIWGALASLQ